MATHQPTHQPTRRCSRCKGVGHDRRHCPHSDAEATDLLREWCRQEYRRREDEARATREARQRLLERQWMTWAVNQSEYAERTGRFERRPTKSQIKLQEIIFDNSDKMPEGLYKELMDALVLN